MIADRILAERRLYRMATFARLAKIASPVNNPAPEILDALNTLLRRYPSGAQLSELRQHFDPRPDDCTLNRWLTHMIDQGRVVRSGSGPTTRYALAPAVAIVAPLDPTPAGAAAPPRLCQSLAQILRRSLSPPLLQPRCRAVFRPPSACRSDLRRAVCAVCAAIDPERNGACRGHRCAAATGCVPAPVAGRRQGIRHLCGRATRYPHASRRRGLRADAHAV